MANPQDLAILKQGVKVWNRWRLENPDIRPDLSAIKDLGNLNLSDANLSMVYFSKANLDGINFKRANLSLANLSRASLRNADLSLADMRGTQLNFTNLNEANLGQAEFSRSVLEQTDFTNCLFNFTVFSFNDFSTAIGLASVKHEGPSSIDTYTLFASRNLPELFLRGCGVPESLITYLSSLRGQAIDFYSCFISYSHSDKTFARRLHDTLQGRGIRCWLDEKQIKPGHDIAQEIDRGIKYWDKTILCCSESAMEEKWWVQFEMKKALAKEADLTRERSQHVRAIIPLDLDGHLLEKYDGEYKSEILSRSVASFKGWEHDNTIFEREVERVIAALRTDEGRETPPTSKL